MFTKMLCAVDKSYVSIITTINFITLVMTELQKVSTLFCGKYLSWKHYSWYGFHTCNWNKGSQMKVLRTDTLWLH